MSCGSFVTFSNIFIVLKVFSFCNQAEYIWWFHPLVRNGMLSLALVVYVHIVDLYLQLVDRIGKGCVLSKNYYSLGIM